MKKALLISALAVLPVSATLADNYTVDPEHTYVSFAINHLGFSTMRGKFNKQSGTMSYDFAAKKASVTIEIDASSIDTGHEKRDAHLSSPDFLNVVENPTITFKSTKSSWNGIKLETVTGDLTILGVSKPVTLKVTSIKLRTAPIQQKNCLWI